MPRVTTVKKSRKSPGKCYRCDKTIPKGTGYRWWKFRFGGKHLRCLKCPYPRGSELTQSDKLSRCYAAGEAVEDALDMFRKDHDLNALKCEVETQAEQLREVAAEYEESADNVEEHFPGSPQADEIREKAGQVESDADELENALGQAEEWEDVEAAAKEAKDDLAAAKEEWVEGICSELEGWSVNV